MDHLTILMIPTCANMFLNLYISVAIIIIAITINQVI
jgi:hypothetical protein